ncbi:MAG: hypothetical protein R2861_04315 [Desulfobacterales bacterium]
MIGEDKKGIVAKVSNFYIKDINIEDINQRIMGDGYFVMTMLVDIKMPPSLWKELQKNLKKSVKTWNCEFSFSMKIYLR